MSRANAVKGRTHTRRARLQLDAPLRRTTLAVKAELKNLVLTLRPTAAALQTQDRRGDTLPGGRVMHRLLLTYALKLQEGGSVTPRLAPLARCVYDGALEGHVYAVHDANKKRVAFGDVYPKSTKLAKGAPHDPPLTTGLAPAWGRRACCEPRG